MRPRATGDDGGPGSEYDFCSVGDDVTDCGTRAAGTANTYTTQDCEQQRAEVQDAIEEACAGLPSAGWFILVYPSALSLIGLIAFSCVCCKMNVLEATPDEPAITGVEAVPQPAVAQPAVAIAMPVAVPVTVKTAAPPV